MQTRKIEKWDGQYSQLSKGDVDPFRYPENVRDRLVTDGFARLSGSLFDIESETLEAFNALVESFDDLPIDENDETGRRRRRYGRYVLIPWTGKIESIPSIRGPDGAPFVEYYQPVGLNQVDGGRRRPFTPLHPAVRTNMALADLIRFDFRQLPVPKSWEGVPVLVGVHQVVLSPEWMRPSVSSPNCLHRDGEPYTFVHLIRRENIAGGENYVTAPECAGIHPKELDQNKILARFTLERTLDSFVVDDQMVAHYVDEVYPIFQNKISRRAVFLIDFTPMVPQFV